MANRDLVSIVQEITGGRSLPRWGDEKTIEQEVLGVVRKSLKHRDYANSARYANEEFESYDVLKRINEKELASLIEGMWAGNKEAVEFNTSMWSSLVAPPDLIQEDFKNNYERFELFWGKGNNNERDLLIRAIPGHAHSGHSTFAKAGRYPNTMTKDVAEAVSSLTGIKLAGFEEFTKNSQEIISEILYLNESFFHFWDQQRREFPNALNRKGKGLTNISIFKKPGYPFNMLEWNRGFYFGGNFDNYSFVRTKVHEKYGHEMGGGECHAMDINVLKKFNISLGELAEAEYKIPLLNQLSPKKRKKVLKEMGAIIDKKIDISSIPSSELCWDAVLEQGINPRDYPERDIRNVYMREEKGKGVMDDVAIGLAGFLPDTLGRQMFTRYDVLSRVMGAYMADRIDTLEKDSEIIMPGGQDEVASQYCNLQFKKLCENKRFRDAWGIRTKSAKEKNGYDLVPYHVLVDFTAASAMLVMPGDKPIHSSQAYFLKKQRYSNNGSDNSTCTLKEILNAVNANAYSKGLECQPIVSKRDSVTPQITVGFHRVPWKDVLKCFNYRLGLVYDSSRREKNLMDFYSCNGRKH
ncbi:MAG: hypothetical protein ACOCQX_04675 [Candidatus Nanoarchaeia archaeon]